MFQDIFADLFFSIESVSERSRLTVKQFLPHNPCVSPYSDCVHAYVS
jgi:hypothetical protein